MDNGLANRTALGVVGQRVGSRIIHFGDGYFYYKHNDRNGSPFVTLRCKKHRTRGILCRGRAVVSRDGQYYTVTQNHTGHGPDMHFVQERELRLRILNRVRAGDSTPFAVIVRNEGASGNFSVEARSRLTAARLRTAMLNARSEHLPRIPRNLSVLGAYLSLPQYYQTTRTVDGQDNIFAGFCGVHAEGTVSVVFSSRRMMNLLQGQRQIFADGTFRKRARKPDSSQIFSISVTWSHQATNTRHTITVLRVFMQKRTMESYIVLLNFLLGLMPDWEPDSINCDNERAMVNAFRAVWPNARIVACLWHYAVDVFKYSKGLGLHAVMQASWVFDAIVRSLCAIPLLPTNLLYQGLLAVGHWARMSGFMHSPHVRALFAYMEKEWMSRRATLSVFGSHDRTNNVSESANAALCWHIRQDRPNVYELIRAFVLQEDQFMVDIHALSDGRDAGRAIRVATLYNDQRIQNLTESLMANRITVLQFLMAASKTLQAPYDEVFA